MRFGFRTHGPGGRYCFAASLSTDIGGAGWPLVSTRVAGVLSYCVDGIFQLGTGWLNRASLLRAMHACGKRVRDSVGGCSGWPIFSMHNCRSFSVAVHDQIARVAMVAHDSIHLPDRRVALAMHACHDHHQRIRTRPWSLWLSL